MAKGFKIADAYVEIVADKDRLKDSVREIPDAVGAEADRAGKEIGDRLNRGLARAVEQLSVQVEKARRREVEAFGAVHLAQMRLNEARAKGTVAGSALLALEQKLTKAKYEQQAATGALAGATNKLSDAQRQLAVEMENVGRDAGPAAGRAGDDIGGKLSQGIRMSVIRNSPLIVAAIAGGLAVGGPLMMTAATALFATIGIVAAAQSQKVQSAWLGTWQSIKAGAIEDAAVIEPVLVRMAGLVGASFDRLRPSLRNIFADAAPQIEVFAKGMLALAENAMPGFERSIARSMPVSQGFADLLAKTGTGLTSFFDNISEHSPAAGAAFSALGDIIAALLPILGTLLGQGAELAAVILPPVAQILGVVADALEAVGPLLPVVAAGFMAFKVVGGITSMLDNFAGSLTKAATNGGMFSGIAGKMAGGLGGVSAAAGPAGAGVAFMTVAIMAWLEAGKKAGELNLLLGKSFEMGGSHAKAAGAFIDDFNQRTGGLFANMPSWISNLGAFGYHIGDLFPSGQNASKAMDELRSSLDTLGNAQLDVELATTALRYAIDEHGEGSKQAAKAAGELSRAQAEVTRLAAQEEKALRGVTEAMVDQINQSRASVDSQFAFELAMEGVEDALARQQELMKSGEATADELEDAARDVAMAYRDVGQAASDKAMDALPASLNDAQKAAVGARAELDYYRSLIAQGVDLPQSLDDHLAYLEGVVSGVDMATIEAAILKAKAEETGTALNDLGGITASPTIDVDDKASTKIGGAKAKFDDFGKAKAKPVADLDANPLFGGIAAGLSSILGLHGQRPRPIAGIDNNPLFSGIASGLGSLFNLHGQRPTPVAGLDAGPFGSVAGWVLSYAALLGGQRPTPVAQLDANPFSQVANWMSGTMGWLNNHRANPTATLWANTWNAESAINWAARNRTAYISVIQTIRNILPFGAMGGQVGEIVRGFAGGGSPSRSTDGKLSGPGGPLDDMIGAISNTGELLRVANQEWIINALVSQRQGHAKMAALNAGLADIVVRGRGPAPEMTPRRFADGGPPGGMQVTTSPGRTVTIEHVSIHIQGTFDLASSSDLRSAAQKLRQAIIDLERETS